MPNPWVLLGLVLLWIATGAAGFGAGWHFKGTESATHEVKIEAQAIAKGNQQNAADTAAAEAHAAERVRVEYRDRIVMQEVSSAVASSPDYRACQLKPADLDLLNQAIGGDDGKR